MAAKLIGTVLGVSTSTDNGVDVMDFTVGYICTEYIGGATSGQAVVRVDAAQNDAQMQSALKVALANYVNSLAGTAFTSVDVRGCSV